MKTVTSKFELKRHDWQKVGQFLGFFYCTRCPKRNNFFEGYKKQSRRLLKKLQDFGKLFLKNIVI